MITSLCSAYLLLSWVSYPQASLLLFGCDNTDDSAVVTQERIKPVVMLAFFLFVCFHAIQQDAPPVLSLEKEV